MSIEIRPCRSVEEVRDALNGIGHYFGDDNDLESAERFTQRMEIDRVHAAWDGDGSSAARARSRTGCPCRAARSRRAGVTIVGVLPLTAAAVCSPG